MENKVSGATVKNRKEGRKDAGRDFVRKLKLKATEREREGRTPFIQDLSLRKMQSGMGGGEAL